MAQAYGDAGGASAYPQQSQATLALVLGILGIVCCGLVAPFAWYVGQQEMNNIRAGRVPPENEGMARAGQILGMIGTALIGLAVLGFLVFLPLGFLGAF